MNPLDAAGRAASSANPRYLVSGVALDALRSPLAAILGRSQILQRRIKRNVPLSPDAALEALASIERSVWELECQLRTLQDEPEEER